MIKYLYLNRIYIKIIPIKIFLYNTVRTRKFRKLKCVKQNDIPTKLEIQQCLGTLLTHILFNYNHCEMIKQLNSTRSARILQQPYCRAQNDQLKTGAKRSFRTENESEKQDILKSNIHHDILSKI